MSCACGELACPTADEIVATKWVVPIMRVLASEPARFSYIRNQIAGISANVLTERLRYLEDIGVVHKVDLPRPANCQVYELTGLGASAMPVLDAMAEWTRLLAQSRSRPLGKAEGPHRR